MHAAFLARLLNIPRLLIPRNPGILSAIGMLMADIIKDYSLTVMLNQNSGHREKLFTLFEDLDQKGRTDLLHEGIDADGTLSGYALRRTVL